MMGMKSGNGTRAKLDTKKVPTQYRCTDVYDSMSQR